MIYPPAGDSWLLEKEVENFVNSLNKIKKNKTKVLDMGSGSGIQALACIDSGIDKENVLCVDIDKEAIDFLNKERKLKTIQSDLFNNPNIKEKFDLIIFNPPYLPEDKEGYDKGKDTTGGKKGYEVIVRFLKNAKEFIAKDGKILLLISNLSKPAVIEREAKRLGFSIKKLAEERLFFEKLEVWELSTKES